MSITHQQARDMILQVLSEAGNSGIKAIDLYTEVIRRLDEDADPHAVCQCVGLDPDDICRINYH